jgi:hypothetical protein
MTYDAMDAINVFGSPIWPMQEGRQDYESFGDDPYNDRTRDELTLPKQFYRTGDFDVRTRGQ